MANPQQKLSKKDTQALQNNASQEAQELQDLAHNIIEKSIFGLGDAEIAFIRAAAGTLAAELRNATPTSLQNAKNKFLQTVIKPKEFPVFNNPTESNKDIIREVFGYLTKHPALENQFISMLSQEDFTVLSKLYPIETQKFVKPHTSDSFAEDDKTNRIVIAIDNLMRVGRNATERDAKLVEYIQGISLERINMVYDKLKLNTLFQQNFAQYLKPEQVDSLLDHLSSHEEKIKFFNYLTPAQAEVVDKDLILKSNNKQEQGRTPNLSTKAPKRGDKILVPTKKASEPTYEAPYTMMTTPQDPRASTYPEPKEMSPEIKKPLDDRLNHANPIYYNPELTAAARNTHNKHDNHTPPNKTPDAVYETMEGLLEHDEAVVHKQNLKNFAEKQKNTETHSDNTQDQRTLQESAQGASGGYEKPLSQKDLGYQVPTPVQGASGQTTLPPAVSEYQKPQNLANQRKSAYEEEEVIDNQPNEYYPSDAHIQSDHAPTIAAAQHGPEPLYEPALKRSDSTREPLYEPLHDTVNETLPSLPIGRAFPNKAPTLHENLTKTTYAPINERPKPSLLSRYSVGDMEKVTDANGLLQSLENGGEKQSREGATSQESLDGGPKYRKSSDAPLYEIPVSHLQKKEPAYAPINETPTAQDTYASTNNTPHENIYATIDNALALKIPKDKRNLFGRIMNKIRDRLATALHKGNAPLTKSQTGVGSIKSSSHKR